MSAKKLIRDRLFGLPTLGPALQRFTGQRHNKKFLTGTGLARLQKEFLSRNPTTVQSGPFQGMAYLPEATGSTLIPKLLGSYEAELHAGLAALLDRKPHRIIDVGCAEGYYAAGLAGLLPEAEVYAFDTDAHARRLCEKMAALNSLQGRVHVRGLCDWQALESLCGPGTLIVCDCEGFEFSLLDPSRVKGLKKADILVELHPKQAAQDLEVLLSRFRATHAQQIISTGPRDPSLYPSLAGLSVADQALAVSEFRHGPQEWAMLTTR